MNHVQQILLASGKTVPVIRLSRWPGLPRSTTCYQPRQRKVRPVDELLAARIKRLHKEEPACGVRATWSRLRFSDGVAVNRKKVHRLMKLKGWTFPRRRAGNRPIVSVSRAITITPGSPPTPSATSANRQPQFIFE